jgi:hypothetical protein
MIINTLCNSMRFLIIIPNPLVKPKAGNHLDSFSNIPKIEYIKTSRLTEVGGEGGLNHE